jgi:ABC-type lipoprotein release transport system permease subunit
LIDEKMAQRFWPRGDSIGKRIRRDSGASWITIVGVVGRVKQYGLDTDPRMAAYFPHAQYSHPNMYLVARTSQDPASLAAALVREVHAVEPDVPVYAVRTMQERVYSSLARQRFLMTLLAAFAGFAILLGGVGVYGVMSYMVTQNTHDIGVRVALGAPRGSILRMVIGQGMALAGTGIAAGLAGAAALTRVLATLLFGVSATDTLTFSAVTVFLGMAALLASYIPAYRATAVDPLAALREE